MPIRESGFSMIEVCFSPEHLDYHNHELVHRAAARIDELGMEAYSFHAPFANHIDLSTFDKGDRQRALDEIFCAIEAAAILQVHYFVIHPGPESAGIPDNQERYDRMMHTVEALNQVAERCRSVGIGCLLENKLPHLLFGNTSDVLWILDALEGINIGACLDTGHAALSGDLQSVLHKLAGHLKMVHAHDNHGHCDDHLPPGDGRLDWEMILHSLDTGNFRGGIILELASGADVAATLASARRGRTFLRRIARRHVLARP
ncbi:MAG: sugar phosphate isomerase/epimerase family protein [Chthoniobacterales bacterium]